MAYPGTPPSEIDEQLARQRQMVAYRQTPEYEREMHERGLQLKEQQRRQYDSETQRQRYGVLQGLTNRAFGGLGAIGRLPQFGMTTPPGNRRQQ
jgi:hypothetical protein